ncbi:MAG: FAD-dependent oxidoreductase [Simkaniaceae bacterium]|nr:FAD-dependent oxidoreductase [Candidatus Sacchlamyda saccharinae]
MDRQEKMEDLIIIGAGAGGLVVAIGAAKAGKKVLLIEKGHYGGDCTNFGCIPSKTLISSGEVSWALSEGETFGIDFSSKEFTASKALERVRNTIERVRSHEEPKALEKLGVKTCTGMASFEDPHTLKITKSDGTSQTVQGKKIVLATGSSPFIPPIEGLKGAPYLTNETIFSLTEIPKSLGILGAGPIGCELAQAFRHLGAQVTVIESERGIMPNEDPEASEVITNVFNEENIQLHTRCEANHISYENGKFKICIVEDGKSSDVEVEHLLVSTGRRANVNALNLEKAGVKFSEKGVSVDTYGRTNQSHIFAIGDVVGGPFFTHMAENHGRAVLTTLLLPWPLKKKLDKEQEIPRCTFTTPEIASFGISEEEAVKKWGEKSIATYKIPMSEVDRAICSSTEEGFVKIVTKKLSSKILGATIVAPRAGEMLQELTLAKLYKIPLRKLTRLIHPYPVYSQAIRKCADLWLTKTILGMLKK